MQAIAGEPLRARADKRGLFVARIVGPRISHPPTSAAQPRAGADSASRPMWSLLRLAFLSTSSGTLQRRHDAAAATLPLGAQRRRERGADAAERSLLSRLVEVRTGEPFRRTRCEKLQSSAASDAGRCLRASPATRFRPQSRAGSRTTRRRRSTAPMSSRSSPGESSHTHAHARCTWSRSGGLSCPGKSKHRAPHVLAGPL